MTLSGERIQQIARAMAEGLPGVSHGRPFGEKLDVYKVAGKVFLIVTDDPAESIITVKTEPEYARSLRRKYASIGPGRYLDKTHWTSASGGPRITAELVEDLVAGSCELVLDTVPRGRRPQEQAMSRD